MTPMQQKSDIKLAYEKFDLMLKKFSVSGAQEILVKLILHNDIDIVNYYQYGDKKQFNKYMVQA